MQVDGVRTALLEKLRQLQSSMALNDGDFAAQLDVPRSTWQLTRTGRVPLGQKIARAAARRFPDLAADAVALFLASDAPECSDATEQSTLSSVA